MPASEGTSDKEDDKINQVDVLRLKHRQELVLIEMPFHSEIDNFQRILFGSAKRITDHLKREIPCGELRKVYSIHPLYFDIGQGNDYAYRGLMHFNGKH